MFLLLMDFAYFYLSTQQVEETLASLCSASKPTLTLDSVILLLPPHLSPLPVPHFPSAGHRRQARAGLAP